MTPASILLGRSGRELSFSFGFGGNFSPASHWVAPIVNWGYQEPAPLHMMGLTEGYQLRARVRLARMSYWIDWRPTSNWTLRSSIRFR